jgi:hypothetical protein
MPSIAVTLAVAVLHADAGDVDAVVFAMHVHDNRWHTFRRFRPLHRRFAGSAAALPASVCASGAFFEELAPDIREHR